MISKWFGYFGALMHAVCRQLIQSYYDEIVQLNASRYATENGIFFALDKPAYDKVCQIAAVFEQSIISEYDKTKEIEEHDQGLHEKPSGWLPPGLLHRGDILGLNEISLPMVVFL